MPPPLNPLHRLVRRPQQEACPLSDKPAQDAIIAKEFDATDGASIASVYEVANPMIQVRPIIT